MSPGIDKLSSSANSCSVIAAVFVVDRRVVVVVGDVGGVDVGVVVSPVVRDRTNQDS